MGKNDTRDATIEFVCHGDDYDKIPKPKPATRDIPEWYEEMNRTFDDGRSTVKECRPFFDALTMGWTIPLPVDINVMATKAGEIEFDYDYDIPLIHPHAEGEIGPGTPYENATVLQWLSPWRIRVPDGYSVLLTSPMNRVEPRFSTFSGVIDYDQCFFNINSPFVWEKYPYTGTIEKGTPIAQIMPFNRDGIVSDGVIRKVNEEESKEIREEMKQKKMNHSRYKDEIWIPKQGSRVIDSE
jgi:hypothetical protein